MPRKHKRKIGARSYRDYSQDQITSAVKAVNKGMTLRQAEKIFKVSMRTIKNKVDKVHMQELGKPRILTDTEEKDPVAYAKLCADWGQPMSKIELRMIAKNTLKLEEKYRFYRKKTTCLAKTRH